MDYFKLLKKRAQEYPEKPFLVFDGTAYTYSAVYRQCILLGTAIKNNTAGTHQCMFIYSGSMYFQALAFLAAEASDNVPVILHCPMPLNSLKQMLNKYGIRHIITGLNCRLPFDNVSLGNALLYNTGFSGGRLSPDICMGVLTSGSTGVPKVLFRTYVSWAGFFGTQNGIFGVGSGSRFFINGSLSFTGNLNFICALLYAGATIIGVMPINIRMWADAITRYGATHIYLVPTKLKVLKSLKGRQIKSVKTILTGSQVLKTDTAEALKHIFPNAGIIEYYGASELNYITYLRYEELYGHPQSVGRQFPGINIFIKDGLIYVDTKYHVAGLEPPVTVRDTGHFDSGGYLIFDGRKDGIVNCGGNKINTNKVENALLNIDMVNDAAVVCREDNLRGKHIDAFVTLTCPAESSYIRSELRKSLSPFEIPRKITILDSLPLNSSGKIDKSKL